MCSAKKFLVERVELLQEDECEDSVGSKSRIVWGEALPQGEEALLLNDVSKDDNGIRFDTRLLDAGLDNIDGHTGNRRDQA
jgi:hypothetical protein